MSAAANLALPDNPSIAYRGPIAKVGISYFTVFLKEIPSHAARACYGLILNETSKGGISPWAHIKPEQFADTANVDKRYVGDPLEFLDGAGWIRHKDPDGRPSKREYALCQEALTESRGEKLHGRCSRCKAIGQFSTSFIAMPRSFFTHLPKALKPATYLVVALVARYSHDHAWNGKDGLIPRWHEVNFNDLERDSGLSPSSISQAVAEAVHYGLIERNPRKGKASEYRTLPQNWEKVPAKSLRLVNQPIKPAKPAAPKQKHEATANPEKQIQPSRIFRPQGICAACLHVAEVEPVTREELEAARQQAPESPPRVPPRRESKPIIDRNDAAMEVLRSWHDPNRKKTVLKA